MYIGDTLARRAVYSPKDLALVDAGKDTPQQYTYADLNTRANRLANWLRKAGISKGDRVGIYAHNGVEFLDVFFACSKLGAILVCYNWRLHRRELIQQVQITTPKVMIFSDEFADNIAHVILDTECIRAVINIEGYQKSETHHYETLLLEQSTDSVTTEDLTEDDIACLIFTSSTTGTPKATQITHGMIAWNTLNTTIHNLQHGDISVNMLPMFHAGGLLVYTLPLLILGGTVIITQKFDAEQVLNLLQDYQATVFAAVPTMYQEMIKASNWRSAILSRLRFCSSGGAPLPVALVEQFRKEKGVVFKQGFSASEFAFCMFSITAEEVASKIGSIGRPNFFVDARVIGADNNALSPNEVGELVLRGPSQSSGYYNNIRETEAATDSDGWFRTGDLAKVDEDGYFYILDRKQEMYISGGKNIYPSEIEQALYQHPDVRVCAVVGVADETHGQIGQSFVVLKPEATTTSETLLEFLDSRLAKYKLPKSLAIVDQLPLSAGGKVLKQDLLQQVASSNP